MSELFSRFESIVGEEAVERLGNSRVAVFGLGGVGGYVAEALARSGVGCLDIIDADTVEKSNINRQLYALHSTVGREKTLVAMERILDINPDIKVDPHSFFYLPETADRLDLGSYDYVVDAIDTVTAKIELIVRCREAKTPIISSMGTGNKLDPGKLEIADIYSTSICPLAKVMRRELKRRGIDSLDVVYSREQPLSSELGRTPGSTAFVPPAAGLMMAGHVVRRLLGL